MRGKAVKALRKLVRQKYPQLEEADKKQFNNYFRRIKKVYNGLPWHARHQMISRY